MSPQLWEVLKIILAFVFGGLGLEVYRRFRDKKKESLEHVKLFEEGKSLQIQVRTNIDKIVDEKTQALNNQISELKDTIIHISTRYRNDLDRYVGRMSDLETKFDDQLKRNEEMENRLGSQIKVREECLEELAEIKQRMNEVERKNS